MLIVCILITNSFIAQINSNYNNLRLIQSLPELYKKVNIGCYVKGDFNKIKNLCELHHATYFKKINSWHYLRIRPENLENFINSSDIENIHIPTEIGTPLNDTMRVNNRINDIHNGRSPLSASLTGSGVIIGFIDTGIDFNHEDFKNTDGTTRIISLWDQTLPESSNTPLPYGYGQHWNSSEIESGSADNHNDIYGHGTTVAGTAVGNGLASGKNKGVAYESDIIVVEVNFETNFLTSVQDATEYIYHIADSLGKPCVINASAGTYLGSHDGNDLSAQYIDNLINSSSGHIFVSSAGNSGEWGKYHVKCSIENDTAFTWFKYNESFGTVFAEIWADTADFNQINYTVGADKKDPNFSHRALGSYQHVSSNLNTIIYDTLRNNNGDQLATVMYWAQEINGVYLIQAYLPNPDSLDYYYRFQIKGTGSYDTWGHSNINMSDIVSGSEIPDVSSFAEIDKYALPDTLSTICSSFQCLESVITVGNYVNESGYINNLGLWVNSDGIRGAISSTSSSGPTRNGLMKPDVAASGQTTVSSFPTYLLEYLEDEELGDGGLHYKNGGTSMSSPVVAGVAALYLEKCNQANYQNFKEDLINNTYSDDYTGSVPNYSFGYGKVDGFQTLISSGINDTITHSACDNFLWNSTTYDSSGYFTFSTLNTKNCDSIIVLDLSIYESIVIDTIINKCDSIEWNGTILNESGNYSDVLQTINGCDSVVNLELTINTSTSSFEQASKCESYNWNGTEYTQTGNYTETLETASGCDSVVNLELTINTSTSSFEQASKCESYNWNGTEYTQTGNYTETLENVNGCDSIAELELTINMSTSTFIQASNCETYNWNGTEYTESGVYIDSNQSIYGCDSLVFLNLTLSKSYNDTINISACNSMFWDDSIYNESGLYTNTYSTINNCDSLVTIDLTLNNGLISPLRFDLTLDWYCLETYWTIKDDQDSIWYDEGPYDCLPLGGGNQANNIIISNINLKPNKCYQFELHDLYGDGMSANDYDTTLTNGEWILKDYSENIIFQGLGNFGNSISTEFFIESAIISSFELQDNNNYIIKAQPNPFKKNTLVTIKGAKGPFEIVIFDINGRIVYGSTEKENIFNVGISDISKGIYWLKIKNQPNLKPLKLVIE